MLAFGAGDSRPALTGPAAAPGSSLPLCSTYRTGPRNAATVTTDPSVARTRETMTAVQARRPWDSEGPDWPDRPGLWV